MSGLVVWGWRDGFIDREEGTHVHRAIETYDAMFGSPSQPPSLGRLLSARIDQPKVWYGWPSYLPEVVAWKVLGKTYDNGVLSNVFCLAAIVALAAAIAWRFDPRAAPLAALFHALLPGCFIWAHFFNVTLAVMAFSYLAILTVLMAGPWDRAARAVVAGLACAAVTVAKSTTVFFWGPLVAVTAWRALMIPGRRALALRNLGIFSLALLPAAVHYALAWEALRWWATRVRVIYAFDSAWSSFGMGAWQHTREVLLPFHVALAALGLIVMVARRSSRRLGLALAAWPIPSLLGVFLTAGLTGTARDVLPLALAPALLASLAFAGLPRAPRVAALWSLLAFGCLFIAINSRPFDDTAMGRRLAPLRPYLRAAPDIRRRPFPPLLDVTIRSLTASTRDAACWCLPSAPYPIPPGDRRPAVLLDHTLIGPENLTAVFALAGREVPWNLGYPPYALPDELWRTALACASAAVIGEPSSGVESFGFEAKASEGRRLVRSWGEGLALGDWPGVGVVTLRRPTETPLCEMSEQAAVDAWVKRWPTGGREGRYYGDYLRLLLAGGRPAELAAMTAFVREAAEQRLRTLQAGHDVQAAMFGEEGVTRDVRASLERMRILDPGRSLPSLSPGLLWLREGSALPLKFEPVKLGDGGFQLQWGEARFPARLRRGEPLEGTVAVTNRGVETWPSLREARGPAYAVRLGCRVQAAGADRDAPLGERSDLPGAVAPGAHTTIAVRLDAPPSPGAYRLECDLLQELHDWFSSRGNPKLAVDFTVD